MDKNVSLDIYYPPRCNTRKTYQEFMNLTDEQMDKIVVHHVVRVSQNGSDYPGNLIGITPYLHRWVHERDTWDITNWINSGGGLHHTKEGRYSIGEYQLSLIDEGHHNFQIHSDKRLGNLREALKSDEFREKQSRIAKKRHEEGSLGGNKESFKRGGITLIPKDSTYYQHILKGSTWRHKKSGEVRFEPPDTLVKEFSFYTKESQSRNIRCVFSGKVKSACKGWEFLGIGDLRDKKKGGLEPPW